MKHITNIVNSGKTGKPYYVSTADTPDAGWETMIFEIDEDGVIDWMGIYTRHYENSDDAHSGHCEIINHIDRFI